MAPIMLSIIAILLGTTVYFAYKYLLLKQQTRITGDMLVEMQELWSSHWRSRPKKPK